MNKTLKLIVLFSVFLVLPLTAGTRFYTGVHGDFSFPAFSGGSRIYGSGGGASLEGGVYLDDFSLGLQARFFHSPEAGPLIQKMTDFTV